MTYCDICKKLDPPVQTLATHGTTDSRETAPDVYEETAPRCGCAIHKVAPMVYTLAGDCIPFERFLNKAVQ